MTASDTTTGDESETVEDTRESFYDDHPFTFGIWRNAEPVVDANEANEADEAETEEAEPEKKPLVADGGVAVAMACPSCDGSLVNVQGVPACSDCDWTAQ
ncbi:hypothetical protein [Haloarchaeobius sp. DFWS5]|uniref:hypothetical protein n=1 Tax=Haloarchaeobius sp. DFWS5 TaxID=3446114 RepID=UPI003EBC3BF5